MVYDFATRMDKLGTRRQELDNKEVTYRRTGETDVSLTVSVTEPDSEELFPNLPVTAMRIRFYYLDAEDLVIGGNTTVPKPGDQIVDGDLTCEVMSLNDKPCYEYMTQTRKRMRIHTKVIGA